MARAEPAESKEESDLAGSGDAMMLLINRALWDVISHQAEEEGRRPGEVLSAAISQYIDSHGSESSKSLMRIIKEFKR
jgi:hypothetical protein